jgi:hypothetical protein
MTLQNVYDIFYKRPDAGYHNKTLYFVRDAKGITHVGGLNRSGGAFRSRCIQNVPSVWKELCYLLCGESLVGDGEI